MTYREKILLIIMSFFLLVGGTYSWLLYQQRSAMDTIRQQIQVEQRNIEQLNQALEKKALFPEQQYMQQLSKVPAYLDLPHLLTQLDQSQQRTGVKINKLFFAGEMEAVEEREWSFTTLFELMVGGDRENEQSFQGSDSSPIQELLVEIPFTIEVEGSYGSIRQFIEALERNDRWVDIRHLSIQTSSSAQVATIALAVYYAPSMVSVSSGPTPIKSYPTKHRESLF